MGDKKSTNSTRTSSNTSYQKPNNNAVAEITRGVNPPTSQGQTAPGKAQQNK